MNENEKISPWWRYSLIIIMVIGFSILGFVTKLAYDNAPPVPQKVIGTTGDTLFTEENIKDGQSAFLRYNLMEHGTIWGHGAYLGPDYSASYLHQEAEYIQSALADKYFGKSFESLDQRERGSVLDAIPTMLKENKYDPVTGNLIYTEEEEGAFYKALGYWKTYFNEGKAPGLPLNYISDDQDLFNLVTFFSWTSWASAANRPGEPYTYTNNFPYDPLAGNLPSADAYFWSAMSLIALLGGLGLLLFLFGKFDFLGWQAERAERHAHLLHTIKKGLTPSQLAVGKYFVAVAALFLLQSLIGGGLAHYRIEPGAFYGIPIADYFPYNLLRTWHLQMAIFWVATAWVGGGLFIAPMLSGREPKYQKTGVNLLFGALLFVVFGSLFGEFLSSQGLLKDWWFWFGNQGSEYLDLGRFWQYLLIAGFLFWLVLIFRGCNLFDKTMKNREMIILFFLAASAIPIFYVPAVFYDHHTNFSIIDNWRFWIIHLWVEGFFEVFATVLVAIIFVKMGIVRPRVALRVIYLDAILYLGAGVVGTGHHWYFTGQTTVNMALSACFSAMEIIPLTLLTLDAWDFIRVSKTKCEECGQFLTGGQKWTLYFLMSVGVWNFVGAGIFGFLINLPIISYFEVGTSLTPNHGHAAMFGVFGMLAIAVSMYCMRHEQTEAVWKRVERWVGVGFWGLNIGLSLMIILDLFPAGVIQLWDVMRNGYWHARELDFILSGTYHKLELLRIFADHIFIFCGALPIAYAITRAYFTRNVEQVDTIDASPN